MDRILNQNQHRCLDRYGNKYPLSIVIGWSEFNHGPIIREADGHLVFAAFTGRIRNYQGGPDGLNEFGPKR